MDDRFRREDGDMGEGLMHGTIAQTDSTTQIRRMGRSMMLLTANDLEGSTTGEIGVEVDLWVMTRADCVALASMLLVGLEVEHGEDLTTEIFVAFARHQNKPHSHVGPHSVAIHMNQSRRKKRGGRKS